MGTIPDGSDHHFDEEAWWDSSKCKEDSMDKKSLSSCNKRAKVGKKKARNGFSECAEEFCKELNKSKEEYQRRVHERIYLKQGQKGHYAFDCKGNSFSALRKGRHN